MAPDPTSTTEQPSERRADGPTVAVWALRVLWVGAALSVSAVIEAALDDRSAGATAVVTGLGWSLWAAVMVASLVPRASSLTVVRIGAPTALAATVAALALGPDGAREGAVAPIAIVVSAAALAAALAPHLGDAFVNGSAYGAERRFALRCPPALGALAVLAWALMAVAAVAGPLLLGAGQWLAGGAATVVGAVVVVWGSRVLHGLSRRWLVLVPTGVVIHDPLARPDSVMAPRPQIVRLGPAPADSDGLDLTLGAAGLALQLETEAPLPVTVRTGRGQMGSEEARRFLVTPTRPAAVLAEAARRRLPVG